MVESTSTSTADEYGSATLDLLKKCISGVNRLNAKHAAEKAALEHALQVEKDSTAQLVPLLTQLNTELEQLAPLPDDAAEKNESTHDAEASHPDADGLTTTFGGQTWQQ